jgi:hypothetical protein
LSVIEDIDAVVVAIETATKAYCPALTPPMLDRTRVVEATELEPVCHALVLMEMAMAGYQS